MRSPLDHSISSEADESRPRRGRGGRPSRQGARLVTGWFWLDRDTRRPAYASLREGLVGEIVATVTCQTQSGLEDVFDVRYDPARSSVDIIATTAVGGPYLLEACMDLHQLGLVGRFKDAARGWTADPNRFFALLADTALTIETITPVEWHALKDTLELAGSGVIQTWRIRDYYSNPFKARTN